MKEIWLKRFLHREVEYIKKHEGKFIQKRFNPGLSHFEFDLTGICHGHLVKEIGTRGKVLSHMEALSPRMTKYACRDFYLCGSM